MDYVLHQAALGSIPRSLSDPLLTNDVNVTGFLNILRAAEQNKVSRLYTHRQVLYMGYSQDLPKLRRILENFYLRMPLPKERMNFMVKRCTNVMVFQQLGYDTSMCLALVKTPDSMYAAVIPLWVRSLIKGDPCYINGMV